jgi:flagellar basal body-associated protein FliL
MAEGDDPNEGGDEIQVGKRSKLPMILAAVGFFVVGAGGGAAIYKVLDPADPASDDPASSSDDEDEKSSQDATLDTEMGVLGDFSVNLRDASGRVLQLKIEVETDTEDAAIVEKKMAALRDSIILLASDYSYQELEGVDGKMRLKDDIHARLNAILEPVQVRRVYFTEFVIQ